MERKTITAENLAEARRLKALFQESSRRKGLTQAQMALELGISQGAVSHYLNGKNALNLRAAVAFSRCIGCPVGDFSPRLAQELGSAISEKRESNYVPEATRRDFSQRLNELLNHYGAPQKHSGRQVALKNLIGVSQESARKWLEGEALPRYDKMQRICATYPCRVEWLRDGSAPMIGDPDAEVLLSLWGKLSPNTRKAILLIMQSLAIADQQEPV